MESDLQPNVPDHKATPLPQREKRNSDKRQKRADGNDSASRNRNQKSNNASSRNQENGHYTQKVYQPKGSSSTSTVDSQTTSESQPGNTRYEVKANGNVEEKKPTEAKDNQQQMNGKQKKGKPQKPYYKSDVVAAQDQNAEDEKKIPSEQNKNEKKKYQQKYNNDRNNKQYNNSNGKPNNEFKRKSQKGEQSMASQMEKLQAQNPALTLAVAEAKRLQELIPTNQPDEIQNKIKAIKDVVGEEDHIIYGFLEENRFDSDKTVEIMLKYKEDQLKKKELEEQQRRQKEAAVPPVNQWLNVARKNMPGKYEHFDSQPRDPGYEKRKREMMNGQNRQNYPQHQNQFPHENNEELMKSLSLAIANQLKMIAEQTRVLNQMQNELQSITTGSISNEVRELLDERSRLEQREEQLKAELRQVSQQINLINIELENKEKEKAEKIKTLANKSAQYGILKKPIARPTQANGHPHSAPQRSQ